jgi:hypothetical protein
MSLSDPNFVLKVSVSTFLAVQAIRQLVLVNSQYGGKTESRAGQVASWMTTTLTFMVAILLFQSQNELSDRGVLTSLFLLFIGVMSSGIAMIYDGAKNNGGPEKNRMWFGVAHTVFAMLIFAYLLYSVI